MSAFGQARVFRLPGLADYRRVHALQERLVAARSEGLIGDLVLLLEHPETVTVGRRLGAMANVLAPGGVPVVEVERGGDVTWHGPGQLVAYPIVGLEGERRDLRAHLRRLEQAVIEVLGGLGLPGQRDERNSGVWLPEADGLPRKVCSVGVACRRWVTWHGLALNVAPDLAGFARIRPCGFGAEVMTRLVDHNTAVTLDGLWEPMGAALVRHLELGDDASVNVVDPVDLPALLGLSALTAGADAPMLP